jgi:preprotein translocase subunit SecB
MSEETNANGQAAEPTQVAPRLSIVLQYIKDISFENPKAPMGLQTNVRPEIQIRVETRATQISNEGHYEVVLDLHVEAKTSGETTFLLELDYAGVFQLANIPPDSLQPLLMIECPRLLFPFARRVVADMTRDGGFPPLMIDPIDFVTLYRQRLATAAAQGGPSTALT